MLIIKDLSTSVELDRAALTEVRGGLTLAHEGFYFGYPWGDRISDNDTFTNSFNKLADVKVEQNLLEEITNAFGTVYSDPSNNAAITINQ